jgi:hypothetical protein
MVVPQRSSILAALASPENQAQPRKQQQQQQQQQQHAAVGLSRLGTARHGPAAANGSGHTDAPQFPRPP